MSAKRPCQRLHPVLAPDTCPVCWRAAHDGYYQRKWGLPVTSPERVQRPTRRGSVRFRIPDRKSRPAAKPSPLSLPCISEGNILERCHKCGAGGKHVRECDEFDKCTREVVSDKVRACATCSRWRGDPAWPILMDQRHLPAGGLSDSRRFNSSIIEHGDGYALAYRAGWSGSEIHVVRLDAEFRPVGEAVHLPLRTRAESRSGAEDPRLFRYRGQLHVAFIGVVTTDGQTHTNMMYARLDDSFRVERVFAPVYCGRNWWEKNWSFFEHDGELFAVYSISPHKILRIDGERATLAHNVPSLARWEGAEPRGGASPVRVGDEFWHFFHDRSAGVYRIGLYTFDAAPPFAPRRFVAEPILAADQATKPAGWHVAVEYPCGAVPQPDGTWVVSTGVHDQWTALHRFDDADLQRRLRSVTPPAWWDQSGDSSDAAMWASLHSHDEYQVRGLDLRGAVVLDVGAHVGTFAHVAVGLGAAKVHCYEPTPSTFAKLERNAARLPGVEVHHAALGGEPGRCRVIAGEGSTGNRIDSAAGDVPIITLDEAIERIGGRVDLLKIDVEGAEHQILPASKLLDRVARIHGEYHDGDPAELMRFLAGQGFSTRTIAGTPWVGLFWAKR